MGNESICKFNFTQSSDLVCHHFIYECTDIQSTPLVAEHYTLGLLSVGEGELCVSGIAYPIRVGDFFFLKKGERFSISGKTPPEYTYICFSGRRAVEYVERLGITAKNRIFPGYADLIPFWRDTLKKTDDRNIDLYSEAVLLYSLASLHPERKEHNDALSRVLSITGERFADPELSLNEIAEEIGYHAKYLSSLFKKKQGVSYSQYLRDMRIKHAIFLMEQGLVSVKNVALLSGFGDALYFSKVFRETQGITPTEYILRLQEEK